VFSSAFSAVGGHAANDLRLPKVNHAVVVLIDGLGYENLTQAKAYSRFLNSQNLESIRCEFPSTTATSITGFATGVRAEKHGVIGYSVFDRNTSTAINLLTGWESSLEAKRFKKINSISDDSSEPAVRVIAPKSYQDSGFTALTMAGAQYLAADSVSERFAKLTSFPSSKTLTYLYVPELDQLAHRFGVSSTNWLEALEDVDMELSRLSERLQPGVGIVVTADHGIVDVPRANQVMLEKFDWYVNAVAHTSGDPRCNYLYLKNQTDLSQVQAKAQSEFGGEAYVCSVSELAESGWANWEVAVESGYAPDLIVIWRNNAVGYDQRTAKPHHLKMVGQHGGLSDIETRVPLIKFGAF